MRYCIVSLLLAPILVAQTTQPPRPCPPERAVTRLQRLLREKGTDAVVDEILRPGRELWAQIKDALLKPDGSMYFSDHVESTLLPEMSGVLVTQDGSDLLVAMPGADVPDVTLRLQTPVRESGAVGATVIFAGTPVEFSRFPFMVIMLVRGEEIRFLPAKDSRVTAK